MSAPKGDTEIELYFAGLIVAIAVAAALLGMYLACSGS